MIPSLACRPPLVFVSYDSADVELHDHVLALTNRLREEGVDARVDLYEPGPAEGWEHWRERHLLAADFVVVVCTASYRRCFEGLGAGPDGLQVRWESGFLRRRLHDDPSFGARVLPVLPPGARPESVPEALRSCSRYALPGEYDELYRRITGQPARVGPPLGSLRRGIDNLGRRPPVFEGRKDDLTRLREALARASDAAAYTVLTGMGGIGKTRLAREHAWGSEPDYDVRWWVRAGELASLQEDLVRLGTELGILAHVDGVEQATREVLAWLSSHQRWLLVLDDADGSDSIRGLLPHPGHGHVLVTSRARAWRGVAEVVEVKRLTPEGARALLVRRSGRRDDGLADAVAEALGHLPLALVQAAAYMEATGCSFRGYLDRFEREGLALLRDPKSLPDGDHEAVATTWEISLAEIRNRRPAAATLLDWLAFLDPGGVPIALLRERDQLLPAELAGCVRSPLALDDAIAVLLEFGMIEREDDVLQVHRLVQAVTREKLSFDQSRQLAAQVVRWVCSIFAYVPDETLVRDVPIGIAEQVMALGALEASVRADQARVAQALSDVGDFHLVRGASRAARGAYDGALRIREAMVHARPDWVRGRQDLSSSLNRLGKLELRIGDLAAARRCFRRAYELRRSLVLANPGAAELRRDLASSLERLGDLEERSGNLESALQMVGCAVDLREELVERTPRDVLAQRDLALSLGKLGRAHLQAGHVDDAKALLRRAVDIVERLARARPATSRIQRDLSHLLNDWGEALMRAGELDAARELLRRNASIAESLVGEDPENARARRDFSIALNRWGLTEQRAGRIAIARNLFLRSLDLRGGLARADPHDAQAKRDLASSLHKLGALETEAGNVQAAQEYFQREAEVHKALLQADPYNARARKDLADVLEQLEDLGSAPRAPIPRDGGPAEERRAPIHLGTTLHDPLVSQPVAAPIGAEDAVLELGRAVRDIDATLDRLDDLVIRSGNVDAARDLTRLRATVEDARARFSPDTLHARRELADTLYSMGKTEVGLGNLSAARDLFRRCVEMFETIAATDPADTEARYGLAVTLGKLGKIEMRLGDWFSAGVLFHRCSASFHALVTSNPADPRLRRDLAISLIREGTIAMEVGNLDAAREHFRRSHGLLEALEQEPTKDPAMRRQLAHSLLELGVVEERAGDLESSRRWLQRHLDVVEALATGDGHDLAERQDVVKALCRLADVERRLGNPEAARELYRRLLAEREALETAHRSEAWAALDMVLLNAEGLAEPTRRRGS